MKLILNRYVLLLIALFIASNKYAKAQTIIPGEIPVSYDVSSSGTFQYTVPLRIPPGIKDMVPNLAITYNSQGGSGNLGMGWSVSGLSAITRGLPTIFHNQYLDPINFNSNDVLLLDGQRLFWNSATSSFLTEVKNFATIKSFGTAGNGPSYFTVEYPNGTVFEYGNSTSSKMYAQGKSDVLMWPVNKIYDVHGNYITFEYTNLQSTGEYRILQIIYGNNSTTGTGIPITIGFNYINRQNPNKAYMGGSEVLTNKLLSDITIKFSNNVQANQYAFTYDQNEIHPRLTKIQELRDGTNILEPIDITWASSSTSFSVVQTSTSVTAMSVFAIGDFNGDGYSDYATTPNTASSVQNYDIDVYENDKSNDFNLVSSSTQPFVNNSSISSTFWENASGKFFADWNGDGKDDMVLISTEVNSQGYSAYRLHLFISTGSQLSYQGQIFEYSNNSHNPVGNAHEYYISNTNIVVGDFDGDKRMDFIVAVPNGLQSVSSGYVGDGHDFFIVGAGYSGSTTQSGNWGTINPGNWAHVGTLNKNLWGFRALDYDGDGKTDLMITSDQVMGMQNFNGTEIFPIGVTYNNSNPVVTTIFGDPNTSYTYNPLYFGNYPTSVNKIYINTGDFNGDGKDDLLYWEGNHPNVPTNGAWYIYYSTGSLAGFSQQALPSNMSAMNYIGPNDPAEFGYFVADFNGDGLDDIIQLNDPNFPSVNCDYNIYYSKGNHVFAAASGSISNYQARQNNSSVGDFNGDGQADLLCHNQGTGNYIQKLAFFYPEDKRYEITSIGHAGKTLYIEQELLNRDGDYTQSATLTYPYVSRLFAFKVVKSLSDNFTMNNSYTYKNLTMHAKGFGLLGFDEFEVENNVGQKTYQKFNLTSRIPYLSEQTTFDAFGSLPYGSRTTYQQLDFSGGASGISRIIINNPSTVVDYINGVKTETTITTGPTNSGTVFYDYGKVEETSVRTKDLNGGNNTLEVTTNNYGSNWATLKGKPESVTVYSDIDPGGANGITRSTEYAYYTNGDIQTVKTDPGTQNEKVKDYSYDAYGNVSQTDLNAAGIAGGPITNTFTHTSDGKFLAQEQNTMGYTTTYSYGNLAFTWGNLVSKTDNKGIQTQYEYDALNRLTKETDVSSGIETYHSFVWAASSGYAAGLTDAHLVTGTTNSYDGSYSYTVYDKYGQVLRKVSPTLVGDLWEDFTYYNNGLLKTATAPYQTWNQGVIVTTTYLYDNYNRETQRSTNNNGSMTQTSYSIDMGTGLLHTTVSNPALNTWKTSVTCGKTVRSVISSGSPNHTIDYTYHGNGTVATTVINANSSSPKTFSNSVDAYGRVTAKNQPNAGSIGYDYDALDRVIRETLANGTIYEYTYDNLDRVIKKQEPGNATWYSYVYENMNGVGTTGELTLETAPNGEFKQYAYTNEGWLQSVKESFFFETIYSYYPNGQLRYYTFKNDLTLEYKYHFTGMLNEVTLLSGSSLPNNQKLWLKWAIDPFRQQMGAYHFDLTNQPIYTDERGYTLQGLPTTRSFYNHALMTHVSDVSYTFDVNSGNLLERYDNLPGRNNYEFFSYDYHYDHLLTAGQSISWGPNQATLNMDYDEHGNILQKDDVAPPAPSPYQYWKYDDYALKTVQMPSAPPFPPTVAIPHFRQNIEYYPFQKVKKIREDQNNEVFFTYGPDDQRISATYTDLAGGGLIKTKYYAQNYERIDDPINGLTELFYVWAEDELIAILKRHTPQGGQTTTGNVYYPVRDHLGSITHLLDITGMGGITGNGVVEERSYDAWGRTRDPNNWMVYPMGGHPGNWITDRGYTGHEHIFQPTAGGFYDNNIINMDGRLYDPQVGRMFSPDPYIPDGTNTQDYNKYIYARNNPLKYTDPDGNFVFAPILIGIAYGALIGGAMAAASYSLSTIGNDYNKWNSTDFWRSTMYGAIGGGIGGGIGGAFAGSAFAQSVGFGVLKSTASQVGANLIMGNDITVGTIVGGAVGGLVGGTLPQFSGIQGGSIINAGAELGHSVVTGGLSGAVSGGVGAAIDGKDIGEGIVNGAKYGAIGATAQSSFMIAVFGAAYIPEKSEQRYMQRHVLKDRNGKFVSEGRFSPVFRRGGIYGLLTDRGVTWGRNLSTPDRSHAPHERIHYQQAIRDGFGLMQGKGIYEQLRHTFSGGRWNPYGIPGTNEFEAATISGR